MSQPNTPSSPVEKPENEAPIPNEQPDPASINPNPVPEPSDSRVGTTSGIRTRGRDRVARRKPARRRQLPSPHDQTPFRAGSREQLGRRCGQRHRVHALRGHRAGGRNRRW